MLSTADPQAAANEGYGGRRRLLHAAENQRSFSSTISRGRLSAFGHTVLPRLQRAWISLSFHLEGPKPKEQIATTLRKAFDTPGPVPIGVHVEYRENRKVYKGSSL